MRNSGKKKRRVGWLAGAAAKANTQLTASSSRVPLRARSPRSASTNNNYFTSALTNGPLTAPASGRTGGNGVSAYGSTSSFPTNSYQGSNYWVDVVFLSSGGGAGQPAIRRFVAYRRIADGK